MVKRSSKKPFLAGGSLNGIIAASTPSIIAIGIAAFGISCLMRKARRKHPQVSFHFPSIEDDQRQIMDDVEYHAYVVRPGGQLSTPSMRNNIAHSISQMYDEIRQKRNMSLINIGELNEMARAGQISNQQAQIGTANAIAAHKAYVGQKWKIVMNKLGVPAI